MKTILTLIFTILMFNANGQSQYDTNWCFGDSVGVNFNNLSNPSVFTTHALNNEAAAAISDSNGNLLFYSSILSTGGPTPYGKVFNKLHQVMDNGDSILSYFSASNGSVIIPLPDSLNKYYLFSVGFTSPCNCPKHYLSYSVIDMSLNGGLGKVIEKNVMIYDTISEQLTAIKHANGRDWWLIGREYENDILLKFLITPLGITGPFQQQIGSMFYSHAGEVTASRNGNKIGFVVDNGNMDVYDFDRCTGELSNWIELGDQPYNNLPPTLDQYYGCCFSPDGTRFYVGYINNSGGISSSILQYSIASPNPLQSKVNILNVGTPYNLYQMELGPDNKIYISGVKNASALDSSYKYLTTIDFPNDSGVSCGLNLFSFYLQGHFSMLGLPNMPNYNLGPLGNTTSSIICEGDVFNFNGNLLTTAGVYYDTLGTVSGGCDSIITLDLTVVNVNALVQQSNDTLTTTSSGTIQWYDCNLQQIISGATSSIFVPTVTGNYAAIITEGNCTDTSACKQMFTGIDNMVFDRRGVMIYPNPADENITVTFSQPCENCRIEITNTFGQILFEKSINQKTERINLKNFSKGVYFIKLQMQDGRVAVKKFMKQ